MKYLNTFNESLIRNRAVGKRPSMTSTKDDIKDICLDLTDDGYLIDFDDDKGTYRGDIFIYKVGNRESGKLTPFDYKDIEEVVERVKRYLVPITESIDVYVLFNNSSVFTSINKWVNRSENSIRELKISFTLK